MDSDEEIENLRRISPTVQLWIIFGELHFQSHFWLTGEAAENTLLQIGIHLAPIPNTNNILTSKEKFLLALRFMADGGHYRTLGDAHGVSKSATCRAVHEVVEAIVDVYFDEVVDFPQTQASCIGVRDEFYKLAWIPSVLGCGGLERVHLVKYNLNKFAYAN